MKKEDAESGKRVLFVFQSEYFLYNYLSSALAIGSDRDFHITIAVPENLQSVIFGVSPEDVVGFPNLGGNDLEIFQEAHRWNILLNRRLSRSFNYRSKTVFPTFRVLLLKKIRDVQLRLRKTQMAIGGVASASITYRFLRIARLQAGFLYGATLVIFSALKAPIPRWRAILTVSTPRGRRMIQEFVNSIPTRSVIGPIVQKLKPHLVVVPTLGHEGIATDAIRAASHFQIPSMMLIDNWDNLSSKSLFSALPDFIGTWGPQSDAHAIDIQRMSRARVKSIGAPRFESHFHAAAQLDAKGHKPLPYILYCGTSMYSREDAILEIIDQTLMRLQSTLLVVYRPHPQRFREPGRVLKNSYGSIRVDSSVDPRFWGSLTPDKKDQNLSLSRMLADSLFVVGGLTSTLLEAEILKKRYIGMAHHERFNYSSPRTVFTTYDHYRGIESLPHLSLCLTLRKLPEMIEEHIHQPTIPECGDGNHLERSYFLTGSKVPTYEQRLGAFIQNAISGV